MTLLADAQVNHWLTEFEVHWGQLNEKGTMRQCGFGRRPPGQYGAMRICPGIM